MDEYKDSDKCRIVRQALLTLEHAFKYSAQESSWKGERDEWIAAIRDGTGDCKTVRGLNYALRKLETSVKYDAQPASWKLMRDRWVKMTKEAATWSALASAALALERGVCADDKNETWPDKRSEWAQPLFRVGGSYVDCPFPEKKTGMKAPGGSITVRTTKLGSGAFRNAYKADVDDGTVTGVGKGRTVVVKAIQAKDYNKGVRMGSEDVEAQEVAARYARAFNKAKLCNKDVHFRTGELFKSPKAVYNEKGTCIIARGETLLVEAEVHGEWEKFNSNSGWSSDANSLPGFFSHWTFVHSKGRHLVCDLQGHRGRPGGPTWHKGTDYYLFTDPVVISLERKFGNTDLGLAGMIRWMSSHNCNALCRAHDLPGASTLARRLFSGSDKFAHVGGFHLLRDTFGTISQSRSTTHDVAFVEALKRELGISSLDLTRGQADAIVRALDL